MARPLMDIVLPRLARPLHRQLERYQSGEMTEAQFTRKFEQVLQRQHSWLAKRGVKPPHSKSHCPLRPPTATRIILCGSASPSPRGLR